MFYGDLKGEENLKKKKRGDICVYIYMSDSLCCTAGTAMAVKSNYTPMGEKKKSSPHHHGS